MKEIYIFGGCMVLFQFGKVMYKYYQKRQLKQVEIEIADFRWDTYLKRREEILSVKPDDLDLKLSFDKETAFGVAMEAHTGTEVELISIFQAGEMWGLNTRNARKDKIIFKDENVTAAAVSLLSTAQYHFARMRREYVSVPEPNHCKFYIYTNNDIYSANSSIKNLLSEGSEWQELFFNVQDVIEQYEISRSTS